MNANYLQIDKGFLSYREYSTPVKDQTIEVIGNNHHVFVIDVSGSMYGEIDDVANRFIAFAETKLIKNDTLTVLLFNHTYRVVLQQFLITQDVSDFLRNIVKREFYASGLTNFTAPINWLIDGNLIVMLKDWKNIPIKLYFMSDGGDNQSGGIKNILSSFSKIKSFIKIGNTHVEGFGEYYDKDVLTSIAKHMDGIFIHTSSVDDYINEVEKFANNRHKGVETKVELSDYGDFTFVIDKKDGSILMIEEGKKEFSIGADNFLVVTYSKNRPVDAKKISVLDENGLQAAYATAILASRFNQLDLGVLILSDYVKDPHFAEMLETSLLPTSFAVTEKEIQNAISDTSLRYQDGKRSYLVGQDKDQILDILFLISKDKGYDGTSVKIHKPESYTPISLRPYYRKKRDDGKLFPKFISENPDWTTLHENSFIFKDDTTNVSIQFYDSGSIELDQDDVMAYNLQPKIKGISKFNNFILFDSKGSFRFKDKNGIPVIFIKNITENLYNELRTKKAIHRSSAYASDKVFKIRLDMFPIVNRKRLTDISSADYGKLLILQQYIQCENRALGYFYDQIAPKKEMRLRFGETEAEALKTIANIDASGNYKGAEIGISHDLVKRIFKESNLDYNNFLPKYTTKAKAGQIKPFDELTLSKELPQLLVDAGIIAFENAFEFSGDIQLATGKPFNSISSLTSLKENLLINDNHLKEYINYIGKDYVLLESNALNDYNQIAKKKVKDLTKDLKKIVLKEAGVDFDSISFEDILTTPISDLAIDGLENHSEKLMANYMKEYLFLTKKMSNSEKVEFLDKVFVNTKKELKEISYSKFLIKLAFIAGKKGFTDQVDRFNPNAVNISIVEIFELDDDLSKELETNFTFTPEVSTSTLYIGSIDSICKRLGIDLE